MFTTAKAPCWHPCCVQDAEPCSVPAVCHATCYRADRTVCGRVKPALLAKTVFAPGCHPAARACTPHGAHLEVEVICAPCAKDALQQQRHRGSGPRGLIRERCQPAACGPRLSRIDMHVRQRTAGGHTYMQGPVARHLRTRCWTGLVITRIRGTFTLLKYMTAMRIQRLCVKPHLPPSPPPCTTAGINHTGRPSLRPGARQAVLQQPLRRARAQRGGQAAERVGRRARRLS